MLTQPEVGRQPALNTAVLDLPAKQIPIAELLPKRPWADRFADNLRAWAETPDAPWTTAEAGWPGDFCTIRHMVNRFLTEPVRRPVRVTLIHIVRAARYRIRRVEQMHFQPGTWAILNDVGNNRVGVCAYKALATVPAIVTAGLWQVGEPQPDWATLWEAL